MNSPNSTINETDLTFGGAQVPFGRAGILGVAKRGPINRPDILVTSWPMFVKLYGGLMDGNPFAHACKRALEGGCALRVANIRHYTDITNPASYDAQFAAIRATSKFSLSIAIIAGVTLTFTIGASNVSQVFDTSSINTLNLLAAKIKAQWATTAYDVVVISATEFKVSLLAGDGVLTVGGAGAPVVTETQVTGFIASATSLFDLTPKYPGSDYNNLRITCGAASNGASDSFDLVVEIVGDSNSIEVYRNLKIAGNPTAGNSNYLEEIVKNSYLVSVVYHDLSGIGALPIVPEKIICRYSGGSDGSAAVDADYIGSSVSKTGFQAFNPIDDIMDITYYGSSTPVIIAGAAYASSRKDLVHYYHLSNGSTTTSALIAERAANNIDSNYSFGLGGGLSITNELNSQPLNILASGDLLALIAASDKKYGPWYSFAGLNRGIITNALGVVNNFGTEGQKEDMNLLANRQINMVINRNSRIMLWGSQTSQLSQSQLSLINVRRFLIYLKKFISPILQSYLEEPCEITTWKRLYLQVKPELDNLATQRAINGAEGIGWRWVGDQFANTEDDYIINTPADVAVGKYKCRLFLKPVASTQEIALDITLSAAGVSLEDVLGII